MIPLTARDSAIQNLPHSSRRVVIKLEVDSDGAGTYVDLCNYLGVDWLVGMERVEHVDTPVAELSVRLKRAYESIILAPLAQASQANKPTVGGAYVPLLDAHRRIRMYTATVGEEETPASGDYMLRFEGRIDVVGTQGEHITLKARDAGGELLDMFIETDNVYGSGGGSPVQTEMQDILNDHVASPPTLYVPTSPSWNILSYQQQKEPVLEALRKLAQQFGGDVRYRWDTGTSAFRLTLVMPDRAISTTQITFNKDQWSDARQLEIDKTNVRNRVRVVFTDVATGARTSYLASDATSTTRYGKRFMEIAEEATSQIDSAAEAQTLADNVLLDLKDPSVTWEVEVPYFYNAQLGDYYRFTGDDEIFSGNLDLAVVSITDHFVEGGKALTTFQCRGKPTGGYMRWLELQGIPGNAPTTDLGGPGTPGGVAVDPTAGGFTVTYNEPTDPDWVESECHVDTSSGFTPTELTLKAKARSTKFTVGGLIPGTTYYVKIIAVDIIGNKSTASTQIVKATELIAPIHMNNNAEYGVINPNPTLSIFTKDETTTPPDHWLVVTPAMPGGYANTSGNWYVESSTVKLANRALKLNSFARADITKKVTSDYIVVQGDRLYVLSFLWRAADTRVAWYPRITWYDSAKASISTVTLSELLLGYALDAGFTIAANTWYEDRGWAEAPAGACYAKIEIFVQVDDPSFTLATHPNMFFQKMALARSFAKVEGIGTTNDRSIATATWGAPWLDSVPFDNTGDFAGGISGSGTEHQWTVPYDGEYLLVGRVAWTAMTNGSMLHARFYNVGSAAEMIMSEPYYYNGTGVICATVVTGQISLTAGTQIRLQGWHNSGVNRSTNEDYCFFRAIQIGDRQ